MIKEVEAEYYLDKMVFPDMGDTLYRLYLGNSKARQLGYELQLQRGYLEKEY